MVGNTTGMHVRAAIDAYPADLELSSVIVGIIYKHLLVKQESTEDLAKFAFGPQQVCCCSRALADVALSQCRTRLLGKTAWLQPAVVCDQKSPQRVWIALLALGRL